MDKVKALLKEHWPLVVGLGVLYGLVLWCLLSLLHNNAGHFVYTLDDPYIHMAIAKNVAYHGVWGITRHFFASSSSSLLWTSIIALCYLMLGVNDLTPLILNILVATGILVWLYAICRKLTDIHWLTALLLVSVTILTSLPNLIFMGLEHTLHLLTTVMFAYYAAIDLSSKNKPSRAELIRLLVLAPSVILSRFEGLFLVFIVCCLYLVRKRFVQSVITGVVALLPIVIYGCISVAKGWMFLPNSVMLKGQQPDAYSVTALLEFINQAIEKGLNNPFLFRSLLCAILLIAFFVFREKKFWTKYVILLLVFTCTLVFHVLFAQVGWFFRYEAYLVGFGVVATGIVLMWFRLDTMRGQSITKTTKNLFALLFIVLVSVIPFDMRTVYSISEIPVASNNIYDQQYQMARFTKQFYNKQAIALNDIGAVNYYADVMCLDLWGLASMETAQLRMSRTYYIRKMESIAHSYGVKIAVIYDTWFPNVPDSWMKVGEWSISRNYVCGHKVVSFYAVSPEEKIRLPQTLRQFSPGLPSDVGFRFEKQH